ncbi:O-antigen ligase family protein [Marinomonas dokdonensis]|uniref:O-antigen ligase family protein n=1 Tax=Marinomonas dokdonensis TaxID=328224 RepID=UPI0040554C83
MNLLFNIEGQGRGRVEKTGFFLLCSFFIFSFISKPLINMTGFILISLSIFYVVACDRGFFKKNKYVLLFLIPYVLGFLFSFLSTSGAESALEFLNRFKFMLLVVPLAAFVKSKKQLKIVYAMFFLSAMFSILYGVLDKQTYGGFHGFHKIGRTADMMLIACLSSLTFFVYDKKNILIKVSLFLLVGIFGWAILMSEIRGTWLGLFVGFLIMWFFLLFSKEKLLAIKILILSFSVMLLIYISNAGGMKDNIGRIGEQIKSISATENNESNETRIQLWKSGFEFSKEQFLFGVGAKRAEEPFKKFFYSKEIDYQDKYSYAIRYPNEFHNSYLQILIEAGALFLIMFMIGVFLVIFFSFKRIRLSDEGSKKYLVSAMVSSIAFMVAQFFHNDLYSYGSTVFYLALFSACFIINQPLVSSSPNKKG